MISIRTRMALAQLQVVFLFSFFNKIYYFLLEVHP